MLLPFCRRSKKCMHLDESVALSAFLACFPGQA